MADQLAGDDSFRTQTIVWPASTFVTTWTLGGGNYAPTETPATVIPAGNPGPTDNQNVGPILSAVVVALVLALILWFCCRRSELAVAFSSSLVHSYFLALSATPSADNRLLRALQRSLFETFK